MCKQLTGMLVFNTYLPAKKELLLKFVKLRPVIHPVNNNQR